MNQGNYIFHQIVEFLPRDYFEWLVKKYEGNKYVKSFACWNHLLVLIFGQLSNREGLRDLITTISPFLFAFHHLGFGKSDSRSNLSKANEVRDVRIFQEFDVKTDIPAFVVITDAALHDSQVMGLIPYEKDSFYVFDRAYMDIKMLYLIHIVTLTGSGRRAKTCVTGSETLDADYQTCFSLYFA